MITPTLTRVTGEEDTRQLPEYAMPGTPVNTGVIFSRGRTQRLKEEFPFSSRRRQYP